MSRFVCFAFLVVALLPCAQAASPLVPLCRAVNAANRHLGVGRSDGYHAAGGPCRHCVPQSDAPRLWRWPTAVDGPVETLPPAVPEIPATGPGVPAAGLGEGLAPPAREVPEAISPRSPSDRPAQGVSKRHGGFEVRQPSETDDRAVPRRTPAVAPRWLPPVARQRELPLARRVDPADRTERR